MKKKLYLSIDLLKGIAICMIILCHSRQIFFESTGELRLLEYGQMGCQLFFVISGYSISMSWERHKERGESGCSFYKRRLLVIVPGYYIIIAVTFVLNYILFHTGEGDIGFGINRAPLAIICNLLLWHGVVPFANNDVAPGGWFVGTLTIFYLLLPALDKIITRAKKTGEMLVLAWQMLVLVIGIIIVYITGERDMIQNNSFFYYNFIVQLPCFMLGIILHNNKKLKIDEREYKQYPLMIILLILISFILFYSKGVYNAIFLPTIVGFIGYYVLKYLLYVEDEKKIKESHVIKILSKFGSISYYVYLVHGFFVWTIPLIIIKLESHLQINLSKMHVYLLLLPVIFAFSYCVAVVLKRECNKIIGRLGKNEYTNL